MYKRSLKDGRNFLFSIFKRQYFFTSRHNAEILEINSPSSHLKSLKVILSNLRAHCGSVFKSDACDLENEKREAKINSSKATFEQ